MVFYAQGDPREWRLPHKQNEASPRISTKFFANIKAVHVCIWEGVYIWDMTGYFKKFKEDVIFELSWRKNGIQKWAFILRPALLCEVLGREINYQTELEIRAKLRKEGVLLKLCANGHEKNQDGSSWIMLETNVVRNGVEKNTEFLNNNFLS